MSKAKLFYGAHFEGSLYMLSQHYQKWLEENPKVKVISTIYHDGSLLVTYETS